MVQYATPARGIRENMPPHGHINVALAVAARDSSESEMTVRLLERVTLN